MLASKSKMLVGVGPHRMQANVRVSRPSRRSHTTRMSRASSRRTNVKVDAIGNLFNFLKPQSQANPQKRKELVTELLEASTERKPDEERISNLVDELLPFGVKRPVRSTELFGEYQTVFSTGPTKAQLTLSQPDQALEITETKSLGFLPATSVLSGEVTDLNDNIFEIVFTKQETKGGLGGTKSVNLQRFVTVVYLDSDIMVTQQEEQGSEGENVVIYSKAQAGEEKKEASQETDAGSKKTGTGTFFFGGGQKEGTATVAERTVKRKMAEDDAKGKSAAGSKPAGTAATPTTAREQLNQLAAELKEKQELVKEATKNVKEQERRNATVLRASMAANAELDAAMKRSEEAQAKVQDAMQGRTKAQQDLKAIEMEIREARKANLK